MSGFEWAVLTGLLVIALSPYAISKGIDEGIALLKQIKDA